MNKAYKQSNGSRMAISALAALCLGASLAVSATAQTTSTDNQSPSIDSGSKEGDKPSTVWSLPKYEIKVVPQTPVKAKAEPVLGPKARLLLLKKAAAEAKEAAKPDAAALADEQFSKQFSQDVSKQPRYVWSRQAVKSKEAREQDKLMNEYTREVSEKIASNLKVPSQATLVESSDKKYRYLLSFQLLKSGKIANFQVIDGIADMNTVPLPDPGESGSVVNALKAALNAAVPLKTPPGSTIAPWDMLAVYDLGTGKFFTSLRPR